MSFFARCRGVALLVVVLAAGGCASSNTPGDPFEGFNRAMFSFNEGVDNAVLKPVATGYKAVVPEPARDCVGNVFSNINDVFVSINSLLQGKPGDAIGDACRVLINSTVGLLGCFDVASKVGLEKHNRDFGQTFGKWGFAAGPYLVLPVLGPSGIRDGIGTLIYSNLDPVWANHIPTRNVAFSLRAVNRRADFLDATNVLEEAALDKYSFVRDAYIQRRRGMVDEDDGTGGKRAAFGAPSLALNAEAVYFRPRQIPLEIWVDAANQRGGAAAPDQVAAQAGGNGQFAAFGMLRAAALGTRF